jgi:hypothetical protein
VLHLAGGAPQGRERYQRFPQEVTVWSIRYSAMTAAIMALTAACQDRNQGAAGRSPAVPASIPTTNPTTVPAASANRVVDEWLGQWTGPEGTYLLLSKSGDRYVVKIRSLDGPATYEGVAAGDRIEFERDGKTESIRTGSGKDTEMKWLLEKKNCLIIKGGEGFCRE